MAWVGHRTGHCMEMISPIGVLGTRVTEDQHNRDIPYSRSGVRLLMFTRVDEEV